MATEVILPRVDMDMAEGKIARWFVDDGAPVEKGQPLFEIETDKAAMEIEAPASGLLAIRAASGVAIPVGSAVGWIAAPGEAVAAAAPLPAAGTASTSVLAATEEASVAAETPALAAPAVEGTRATPLARRLAREHGIDIDLIIGSGPAGRVQAADVLGAAAARKPWTTAETPAETPADARPVPVVPRAAAGGLLHHARLADGDGVPVVLIHGFGADLAGWRPLVADAGLRRPVIALDLPGHGGSSGIAAQGLDDLADRVGETLAALGIGRALLVGHSLGAAVAATLAVSGAIQVAGLLLLSPAGLGPEIDGDFIRGFLKARQAESLSPWLERLSADPSVISPAFLKASLAMKADPALNRAQEALAARLFPDDTQAFSIRDLLGRIGGPVRIAFGLEDRIIPHRHAFGLPGRIGLHFLQGVGHMPYLEARGDIAAILREMARLAD